MNTELGPFSIQPPALEVVEPVLDKITAATELEIDYSRIHHCELNMAGFVFSTYKHRGWTLPELWEKLPEDTRADIRAFVAKHAPRRYADKT